MTNNDYNQLFNTTGIQLQSDACVLIVRTLWNSGVNDLLTKGAIAVLEKHRVSYEVLDVPGAIEIPFAIKKVVTANPGKYSSVIAFGCVVRGGTPHFDYVCKYVTEGILQLNMFLPIPTIFGVLTLDFKSQANERLGGKHGHKGEEAAYTALKMMSI
jgi:6,7-dimethyl-8-ribityllumazine synthase